jgi:hypothetical protein
LELFLGIHPVRPAKGAGHSLGEGRAIRWENGGMARHEPYGSAADIPSIADMLQKIEGGKLLTRFIARDQRAKLVELERQVREHIAVIDRFYAVVGASQLDRSR